MASLTFNKEGGNWVAYFKAGADFALHIERDEAGVMSMEQSTTGGGYAVVEDFPARARYGRAFDYEFSALVYPKFIRIASTSEPTFAEVVSNGEVTEIKSQSKEIEVTSNGTTEVTPDAGFSYLNSVKVKTNVPTSGEGGGGGTASSVEYLDLRGAQGAEFQTLYYSSACKFIYPNGSNLAPTGVLLTNSSEEQMEMLPYLVAVKIDLGEVYKDSGVPITVREKLEQSLSAEQLAAIPRITESEFYNLNA